MNRCRPLAVRWLVLIAALQVQWVSAQEILKPTDAFIISGNIRAPKTISLQDLQQFPLHHIGDVSITNHKGESKGMAKEISGVLLSDVLSTIQLDTDQPKQFSAYAFACTASDGYTVVYSWNEIFNSPIGRSIYIVTAFKGKPIGDQDERILMISTQDLFTGRRFLKNLERIAIRKMP